jgi:hypothetical protein
MARQRESRCCFASTPYTARKAVQPDPKVVRQVPRPGTILKPRQVVEIVTTCVNKLCL